MDSVSSTLIGSGTHVMSKLQQLHRKSVRQQVRIVAQGCNEYHTLCCQTMQSCRNLNVSRIKLSTHRDGNVDINPSQRRIMLPRLFHARRITHASPSLTAMVLFMLPRSSSSSSHSHLSTPHLSATPEENKECCSQDTRKQESEGGG